MGDWFIFLLFYSIMQEKEGVVNEIHKNARRNFPRRRVIMHGINDLLQADLVEMIPYHKENKNFRYLLTVINVFTKFAWAIPIKTKTAKDVSIAFRSILKSLSQMPKNVQTDAGKEFFNSQFKKLMSENNINHYSTYSKMKASIVERFNRTLKSKMWKRFSLQGTYKWISIINEIVKQYNNSYHRTIKMAPVNVKKADEKRLLSTVYSNIKSFSKGKFNVGDSVRISYNPTLFEKGYVPNWSTEVFQIRKIQITNPVTYLLSDYQKNNISGGFYEQELQLCNYPNTYLVEKILRKRGDSVLVKWLGFDKSHNSWISKNNMEIK